MTVKQQAIDYVMNLENDFSISEIIDKGFSRSASHLTKTQLLDAKAIFHVGFRYTINGMCKTYNTTYRPFYSRPTGIPKSEAQQVAEYIMWLEEDFTINQICDDLNTTRTVVYNAKKRLFAEQLIFHVADIQIKSAARGTTYIRLFSKEDKEFEVRKIDKLKSYKRPKKQVTQRKTEVFTPKDPLRGLVMPIATI